MQPRELTESQREMALPPGEFMHVQDTTKGLVKVYVGPTVVNQTGQEKPVKYNADRRQFVETNLDGARLRTIFVPEDSYCLLHNPATKDSGELNFPQAGTNNPVDLEQGERVNIAGPANFALWPEQSAQVIPGHKLRSNQYLLVEVTNGEKAQQNWTQARVESAEGEDTSDSVNSQEFRTGQLLIIKGTDAGFFVPCTGIAVVPDDRGEYVRDAMTLEQLEFCILVDESGEKRYEHGPQVVFPEPTEIFWKDDSGHKKFRAYELSKISGIYVKVIDDYEENGEKFKAGDELFITGKNNPIYYPRAEHAIVKYGDEDQHFATAIPKGQGRYVLDRESGHIATEHGEQMLLPDPRTHVIVRRILSDRECDLWFPGNNTAKAHNRALRQVTGGMGDQDFVESTSAALASFEGAVKTADIGTQAYSSAHKKYTRSSAGQAAFANKMERRQSYTPPRAITLESKMDGAVQIQVWTGFAVMVVGKDGSRKPVLGPNTVLLNYDETLEVLRLSTGKPKNTDNLYSTVYLNVSNNKVSDVVEVVTRDQVRVRVKLSFHVNFEGEPENWFNVENYVKLLCDRVRSMLKGVVRKQKIEEFFENHVDVIRDTILGPSKEGGRDGMMFETNGMHVIDVDVLGFEIPDGEVSKELIDAQRDALQSSLELQNKQRSVETESRMEELERQLAKAKWDTSSLEQHLAMKTLEETTTYQLAKHESDLSQETSQFNVQEARERNRDLAAERSLLRERAVEEDAISFEQQRQDLRLNSVEKETAAIVARITAFGPDLVKALEGATQAGAIKLLAENGVRLSSLTGTNFMELLRKSVGPGLAERIGEFVDTAAGSNGHIDSSLETEVN